MLSGSGGAASAGRPGGASGLPDVLGGVRDAAADVATEFSSFVRFQERVDELIRNLEGSPAGPGEVGQEPLARGQFGGGDGAWAEASGVFGAYETVISELENLSKLLSDSIEGMGIAVLASHKGYRNVDDDVRDRMAEISAGIAERYGADGAGGREVPGRADRRGPSDGAGDAGGTI
ncbi:hypothetical protein [Streptomyces sp. RK9]|uniref:hypothetical protein n=1 Tax=Streptomyces sp. RK9 TaxID=3239284 RepID=UPI00386D3751